MCPLKCKCFQFRQAYMNVWEIDSEINNWFQSEKPEMVSNVTQSESYEEVEDGLGRYRNITIVIWYTKGE